ncbi:hypothetical protein V494_06622 [Pseudogymnoascus sp. VKM F-4513 (FW-928)]|nr:hypothetical protein V494_06622 [Pseudogymnoascus sp. VKM F-4513 (FW-928)]
MSKFASTFRPLLGKLRNEVGPSQQPLPTPKTHPGYKKALQLTKPHTKKVFRIPRSQEIPFKRRHRDICSSQLIESPRIGNGNLSSWLILDPTLKKIRSAPTKNLQHSNQFTETTRENKANKMRSYVQVITTPTADTPGTTLLLHFDNRRYIIGNVSEGTQRACIQRKIALAKLEDVLLTGKTSWQNNGGLLGMILTVADVLITKAAALKENPGKGKKRRQGDVAERQQRIKLYAAENLNHLLATARRFIFRKGMPLDVIESQDVAIGGDVSVPSWSDSNIQVWAMDITPDQTLPHHSRKRSHEEISEDDEYNKKHVMSLDGKRDETADQREDRYNKIRKGVVGDMFDSNWQLDALISRKLSEVIMPSAIFVRNEAGKIEEYKGPLPSADQYVPDIDVLVRNPWPGARVQSLPPANRSTISRSYIIKNYPQRGTFNPKAAKELGVTPGESFRELTKGKSIVTESGTTVTPDMVMSPERVGGAFAVIELPSTDYIEGLLNRKEWSSDKVTEGIKAIYWILGEGVLADERLAAFRAKYSHFKHIVSSVDCCPNNIAFDSATTAQLKLHLVDSERFPIPAYGNNTPSGASESSNWVEAQVEDVLQLDVAREAKEAKALPNPFDASKVLTKLRNSHEDPAGKGESIWLDKEVLDLSEAAKKRIVDPEYLAKLAKVQEDIPCKDAELITLGTGSSVPSKYRNVSATLLRVPGVGNYLFDCGENTLGQLKRVFGDEMPQILRDLKVIWISHLHADHHLGTVSVLRAWHEETSRHEETKSNGIIVSSEDGMLGWLSEYSHVEDFGYSRIKPLKLSSKNNYIEEFNDEDVKAYGLGSIVACQVTHCHQALAVVFKFPNGFSVAYSGDCRPSSEFARIGKGATVLIHEATFDNELEGDAVAKKHSTTADALWVAKKMEARRILLTHFSQRYQKIPVMDTSNDQIAIVAFDYMRCKVGDFAKVAEFRPALLKLYENEVAVADE